jgi:hypothetical protein
MREYPNPNTNTNPEHATPLAGNGNREPFPPSPAVLEDHPYVRILHYQGFHEQDFDPAKRVPVPLTQAEIRTLAQHHLDDVYRFLAYQQTGGSFGMTDLRRDRYHRERFGALADLLSEEEQKRFGEIMRIRNEYIETLSDPEEEEEEENEENEIYEGDENDED